MVVDGEQWGSRPRKEYVEITCDQFATPTAPERAGCVVLWLQLDDLAEHRIDERTVVQNVATYKRHSQTRVTLDSIEGNYFVDSSAGIVRWEVEGMAGTDTVTGEFKCSPDSKTWAGDL